MTICNTERQAGTRWQGHWIWIPEERVEPTGFWTARVEPPSEETHALFRKTLTLEAVPACVLSTG